MIIYKITNLINNKYYIGKDVRNNPNYYGSGKIIKRAVKRYGKENFKKEILETCDNIETLNDREIYWIEKLQSMYPNGYNLTKGGTGGDTYNIQSDENKEKIKSKRWNTVVERYGGVFNKGKKMTDEQRKKISESKTGQKYKNRKKIKLTEEHKKNISKSNKGKLVREETKKKLSLILKGREFSLTQRLNLSKSLKGNKNALGYKHTKEQREKSSKSHKGQIAWNKGLETGVSSKNYILELPTGEKIKFEAKKYLRQYISILNSNLEKSNKINLQKLIKNKENKNYKIESNDNIKLIKNINI